MRIAIVGSRGFLNLESVKHYVNGLPEGSTVISGGAAGVDTAAVESAKQRGLEFIVFPAMWGVYGKSAGYKRNVQIVEAADRVVAFWDGESKGTKHSIDIAERLGKPVEIIR